MIAEAGTQCVEPTPNSMTVNDIHILDALMLRTAALPDIIHLRAAERGYELTESDKKMLMDTYSKLDEILKEVAAFINIKFPGCERHVRAWNEIDFDTKIGPIKIVTTDREHIKREWRKGLFDLKSSIKVLRNEAVLLVKDSSNTTAAHNIGQQLIIPNDQSLSVNVRSKLRSWVEVISWIAGIIGTAISLYLAFK
nr:hypothetical protein [uncultured Mucilaginibacter sp.]